MFKKIIILSLVLCLLINVSLTFGGQKNRVAQSGMAYLGISMSARTNAMGDASAATVKGIQGMWHNPSVLADINRMAVTLNQVDWLVDTKLYGAAIAYSLGNWGTIGIDLTYMDWGVIQGTRPVDKAINPRGFELTGEIGVEDYALGFAYARRISDKFVLGFKIKRLHESLGNKSYVVDEYTDPETGETIRTQNEKEWSLDDWGVDFGTVYNVGWKNLTFAMTMMNFSRNMKYFYEEFQTPMTLRLGVAIDMMELWNTQSDRFDLILAVDALHPNDHTESVHVGTECVVLNKVALRAGYKTNHGVESLTFGLGLVFDYGGIEGYFDYAYGTANYFKDINRFSLQFCF
jgi:hypothetical protein